MRKGSISNTHILLSFFHLAFSCSLLIAFQILFGAPALSSLAIHPIDIADCFHSSATNSIFSESPFLRPLNSSVLTFPFPKSSPADKPGFFFKPNFHRRLANCSRAGQSGLKEDYRIGAVLRVECGQLGKDITDEDLDFGSEEDAVGIIAEPEGAGAEFAVGLKGVAFFCVDALDFDVEAEGVAE